MAHSLTGPGVRLITGCRLRCGHRRRGEEGGRQLVTPSATAAAANPAAMRARTGLVTCTSNYAAEQLPGSPSTGTPVDMTVANAEADELPRRRLPLWVALALSVATVGPTLAMAGNGQGLISTVGKSIPLVFVIGLVGVSLVAYSFVRLTRHLNHAGSAYAWSG